MAENYRGIDAIENGVIIRNLWCLNRGTIVVAPTITFDWSALHGNKVSFPIDNEPCQNRHERRRAAATARKRLLTISSARV